MPSLAANGLQLQFTLTEPTQATSARYATLMRSDGTGLPHTVWSGAAPAWGYPLQPPTAWGRVRLTARR